VEQAVLLHGVLDVGLQQQGVHLRVDVLDGDLEAVECARLLGVLRGGRVAGDEGVLYGEF